MFTLFEKKTFKLEVNLSLGARIATFKSQLLLYLDVKSARVCTTFFTT